jgi:hypothetical protein
MMWFFRVVETPDQDWACRRGQMEYDRHPDLAGALEHVVAIARQFVPARLLVHRLDGTVDDAGYVDRIDTIQGSPPEEARAVTNP